MKFQYKRVSRHRNCLICGKPDWCSYTPDSKISFCARIITNADRVSRTGWGVFYHEKSLFGEARLPCPFKPPPKKAELAPIEIRDFAYRKLIELAPAVNSKEIIDGEKGLRARKILDFENYGSLPKSQCERNEIAKQIRQALNRNFPDYTRKQKSGLTGLPGFWIDKNGKSHLWTDKDYRNPMLLIPYRERNGLIQACQIRFMGNMDGDLLRFVWLSTPKKSKGISCGSPLHFVRQIPADCQKTILVTEGALKAETTQFFKPEVNVIAISGVSSSHNSLIQIARFRSLQIAFDSDYHPNRQVARQLANLIKQRLIDSRIYGYAADVKVLTWSLDWKGIDDALLQNEPLIEKTPFQWLEFLGSEVQREAHKILKPLVIQ